MNVINMPTGELIPYENNTKIHPPEQVEHIANSIKRFGWQQPIVIDKNKVVIIGHGRLLAAKQMGLQEVPVVHADELSEEDAQALRLADNKLNESPWDFGKLEQELAELEIAGIDMSDFGFDELNGGGSTESDIEEDEIPEPPKDPIAKLGDIWQLGRHRLMCGDSTNRDDVELLMEGETAELLLTDPPYGINVVNHTTKKIGGDKPVTMAMVHGNNRGSKGNIGGNHIVKSGIYFPVIGDDTTDTARDNYKIAKDFSKNQVIFGGNYFTDFLFPSRCWVVWDKENTGTFADAELAWTSFDKGVKLYKFMWNGLCREGIREVEGKTRVHPTQKPVGMLEKILNDFTQEGETVLDCFGGSGSTLIACEQTGRKCFMMELDPHYVDVIIERWQNLTGETAVLLNADKA